MGWCVVWLWGSGRRWFDNVNDSDDDEDDDDGGDDDGYLA